MMSDQSMGNYENDSNGKGSFKSAGDLVYQLMGGADKQKGNQRLSGRIMGKEPDF